MTLYFAHITAAGPVRYGQFPLAIGVLEAPDKFMPISMAFEVGWTDDRLGVWRISAHGAEVPGRFVIVDRQFEPVDVTSA